jgi:hypothetical protein
MEYRVHLGRRIGGIYLSGNKLKQIDFQAEQLPPASLFAFQMELGQKLAQSTVNPAMYFTSLLTVWTEHHGQTIHSGFKHQWEGKALLKHWC